MTILAESAATAAAHSHDALGRLMALGNAVVWAGAMIFFKKSTHHLSPTALNMFKNVIGLTLIGLTILLMSMISPGPASEPPMRLLDPTRREFWILIVSGMIGIAIADTIFFFSLNLAGVGLTAIADCMYTPFVVLFSYLMLGEEIGWVERIGALLIVSAVFLTGTHKPPADRTRRQIVIGVCGAATAVGLMAYGIVLAKPLFADAPVLWTSGIRLAGGVLALAVVAPWIPGLRELRKAFTPGPEWKWTVPGAVLGAYLAMILWIGGFTYTSASIAGMLNQTSTIIAILLAALVLKEKLDATKLVAAGLAIIGIGLVSFHENVRGWLSA